MAFFWQLSGPDSHFERRWDRGNPNQIISNVIFDNLKDEAVKPEPEPGAEAGITLAVGVKDTGASQILIPVTQSHVCNHLQKWKRHPYASTEFASISPIYVETPEQLFILLNERQNMAKITKAKKERRDVSKANGKFCDGPRNLTRANFERGRTFWRLLTQAPEDAAIYGLPRLWWLNSVTILSLALSFWRPDGTGRVSSEHLLVASISEFDLHSQEQGQSWCYRIEEQWGLQNIDELDSSIRVATEILPQKETIERLQDRLSAAIARGPVVLLLHNFKVAERQQLSSLGFDVSKWIDGLGPLLGCNDVTKKEEYASSSNRQFKSRSRSRSPPHTYITRSPSNGNNRRDYKVDYQDEKVKQDYTVDIPFESDTNRNFYVISIVELYKAVTGQYWDRITPNVIFDMMTRHTRSSEDAPIPRNIELDSTHIMQAWLAMVRGPFIDKQTAFLEKQPTPSTSRITENTTENESHGSDVNREIQGLHSVQATTQQRPIVDLFNNSDSDYDD